MLSVRDHDVDDYAALRDMDSTDVGVLTADDQACLDELGRYLILTGAWRRFAIWLLHKHFEPEPGEVFIERAIASPPQVWTTPVERAAVAPNALTATALRFSGAGLVGTGFARPADFGNTGPDRVRRWGGPGGAGRDPTVP